MVTYADQYLARFGAYQWPVAEAHMHELETEPVDWGLCPDGLSYLFFNTYLTYRVLARGGTSEFSQRCLHKAHERVAEAEARNVFEQSDSSIGFPACRLRHLRTKILVEAFVHQTPLDKATALRIAADESALAPGYEKNRWDGMLQGRYLDAIFLLLLVGAHDEASAMVKDARSMRALNVKPLFDGAKAILRAPTARVEATVAESMRATFDVLRDPDYDDAGKGHLGSLQELLVIACAWQQFVEPGDGRHDVEQAVSLIWA